MDQQEIITYRAKQLELLLFVDKLCEQLKIDYYMIGGTLLGAVRHKGFIPWDIDIDIAMRRKDYDILAEYFIKNENEKIFYQSYKTEKNHLSPHALLRIKGTEVAFGGRNSKYTEKYKGIYLDVFPLDEPPKEKNLQKKQAKKIKSIRSIIELKAGYIYKKTTSAEKIIKSCIQVILAPLSFRFLNIKLEKAMTKYTGSGSGKLVSMASHYSYKKQLMDEDIYGKPIKLSYEDTELKAPAKPHEYLEQLFGDYMKLPPEDKRYSELDFIVSVDFGTEEIN